MRLLLAILCVAAIVCGCAVSKATINTYADPNFGRGDIKNLAVFPMRNARLAPSEAQQVSRKISQAIFQRDSTIHIVGAQEASTLLNENDLADDWAKFVENYAVSGIPDAGILRSIGETLEIDALLQGEIVNIYQEDGRYGGNKGTTRVTVRFSLLGCNSGKLLWEATSDGIKGTATTLESAPPIIEAVNLALDKVLLTLPL